MHAHHVPSIEAGLEQANLEMSEQSANYDGESLDEVTAVVTSMNEAKGTAGASAEDVAACARAVGAAEAFSAAAVGGSGVFFILRSSTFASCWSLATHAAASAVSSPLEAGC